MTAEKKRLLVADDEPGLREIVREVFKDSLEVLEASNGLEALHQALKYLPDCILLDIMMPEMGGFVVCEVLKQVRRTQGIPILVVSAKDTDDFRQIALESGAVGFISKPFDLGDLQQRVMQAIEHKLNERREYPRLIMAMPIRVEGMAPQRPFRIHTLTEDISRRGLRFYGEFEAAEGDLVEVHILQGNNRRQATYAGRARIIWLDSRYAPLRRCGARFVEVSPRWLIHL